MLCLPSHQQLQEAPAERVLFFISKTILFAVEMLGPSAVHGTAGGPRLLFKTKGHPHSHQHVVRSKIQCASSLNGGTISISLPESSPEIHAWTEEYQQQVAWCTSIQQQAPPLDVEEYSITQEEGKSAQPEAGFLLPIMPLGKVKCPTETVQLQIFEPRYRLMFRLVNQSRSRRFGVALSDPKTGVMQRVGALCELTHYIPVAERRRIFISSRVVGRYCVTGDQLVSDKPFVVARCTPYSDLPPHDAAELAELEARVWNAMLDVRLLASKLFTADGRTGLGDDAFPLEARRWSPDSEIRARVNIAAGSDPGLMQAVQMAGLLGDDSVPYTQRDGAFEYICTDALREVSEEHRRSNFSFCLLRPADTPPESRLDALVGQNTAERLRIAEEQIIEGRNYLAARSALRDI